MGNFSSKKCLFKFVKGENYMINMFDLFTLTFSGVAPTSDSCSVVSICLSRAELASERASGRGDKQRGPWRAARAVVNSSRLCTLYP